MGNIKLCEACGKNEVGGYVIGRGVYLSKLCLECYKKGGENNVTEGNGRRIKTGKARTFSKED